MASIAEKSRTKEIIDRLQMIIEGASAVPLAPGKISVFKDEIQSLLDELASQIEIELKTYHEVNDRRGKIIKEAKEEAEHIIHQAERSASRMRVSKSATNVAPLQVEDLNEEELSALGNANEIYGASLIYTDEMLSEVSDMITDAYENIRSDYEIVMRVFEEKMETIKENREELMASLQEMDGPERSQQILEIGQLLSSELHISRMKAKMDSDEYDDGSVQLRLDLQEQAEEKTRQAEEKAYMAEQALAQVTAERDALQAAMVQLKEEKKKEPVKEETTKEEPAKEETATFVKMEEAVDETDIQDGEEYEIVYVTEDELEEGEEYEIEYVDEDEYEEFMKQAQTEKSISVDTSVNPVIPRFKKSESIATVPSEKVAKMAKAITTEEKYSGLISRAVKQREKALEEAAVSVEQEEAVMPVKQPENKEDFTSQQNKKHSKRYNKNNKNSNSNNNSPNNKKESPKDEDIKVDGNGKEYVQATMKFDEEFEIMEF